jgi:phenylalanyl-tRNA synthetase beta chain
MRISLNWLNDYIDIKNESPKEMAEKITRAGVNVEGVKTIDASHLVVGHVIDRKDHPNSNHLSVCLVDVGDEILSIICGADNVAKGQKVIVAKAGAVLPGDFEINKVTIRGVESNGMICALYELGIEDKDSNYHKGIHVLPPDAVIGSNPLTYLDLDDTIYELDLNPNRNDCLSYLGFAYEVGAVLDKKVKKPTITTEAIDESIKEHLKLKVATDNCLLYKARMVKDVVIKESPPFIKKRLTAAGMKPINNVVDISNYVMLEYGQPLHFFDKDKIGDQIVVRMAKDGERTITLDNKEKTLIKDDIVITNGKEVIGIAGVMGCANSEIDNNTKNIVIESAIFNPYNVRYTSLRLDLRSEASLRFEKGLNYEYTSEALERACYLLSKYASGKVLADDLTYDNIKKESKIVSISKTKINDVLGIELFHQDIMDAFNRLGFNVTEENEIYTVEIPHRRMDVTIKEDLIEEVGRLYGYDNIIGKLPIESMKSGGYNDKTLFNKQVSQRMRALGLDEVRTYTLISKEESNLFRYHFHESIKLQKPMTIERSIIRQSLLPSLLKTVDYNIARDIENINIYEISNVYYLDEGEYKEETKLAIALHGNYISNDWQNKKIKADFYLFKGIIENLFCYLGLNNRYLFKASKNVPQDVHPGISAEIMVDNQPVGFIGAVHPRLSKLSLFVGEINLSKLYDKKVGNLKYKEVSKFPSITKDLAFLVPKKVEAAEIIKIISKVGGKTLEKIDVFDLYIGEKIDADKKSIAFSLTFTDLTKTLTDDEVNQLLTKIINEVNTRVGGILRDK